MLPGMLCNMRLQVDHEEEEILGIRKAFKSSRAWIVVSAINAYNAYKANCVTVLRGRRECDACGTDY